MKTARKNLKAFSIVILVFAGLTLLNLISEFAFGETSMITVPDGASAVVVWVLKGIIFGLSLLALLPQVFVGVKGILVSNHPNSSKGHIVWAIILLVLAVVGLVSPIVGLVKMEDVVVNIASLVTIAVDVVCYFFYVKYANAIAKAN